MKKIIKYSLLAIALLYSTSCEKGLEELNESETGFDVIDPLLQLNGAVVNASFPTSTLVYDIGIVQQIISPNGGVLAGANFNQDNRSIGGPVWQVYYRNVIRNTHDIILGLESNTLRTNLRNMARIFQAYAFMVLTDTYGDIPYTEAGKGYADAVLFPKYDKQQDIYTDIIKELTEATAALNAANNIETGDVLYSGNIALWKKFGYSVLLRAGMRLSKIDPAKAATTVQAAVAGGVMTANTDNAYVRQTNDYQQPIGNTLNGTEGANFYLTKPFVDALKSTNDPRLSAIAIRYVGATSGPGQTVGIGSTDPTKQIGMPMGKDNGTIGAAATADGLASFYDYSQADRRRINKATAPVFYVTAAQTQLLLAEARELGWITTSTTQAYYEAGVTLHMQQMATFDVNSTIAAGAITTYLTANPFNPASAYQQIGTQYWIASFLNGPEAFANFRRTGFPALTPNPYPGKDITGQFIRRLTYPNSEISVNNANVSAAIQAQGPDNLDTRVWWDKP
jgi:Starch-binding associating with outer membrane